MEEHHSVVVEAASAVAVAVANYYYPKDDTNYPVTIIKKNNKNTYIRVTEDLNIIVTTNYFVTNKSIEKLLEQNSTYINKMIDKRKNKLTKKSNNNDYNVSIFEENYQVIYSDSFQKAEISNNYIYVKNKKELNKYITKYITDIIKSHIDAYLNIIEENIPIPNLKLRKMKTRWGVCNRKNNNITLNLELINYNIECLDYVIVHELCHFIQPNHSKDFWHLVEKYYPNYKKARKALKS